VNATAMHSFLPLFASALFCLPANAANPVALYDEAARVFKDAAADDTAKSAAFGKMKESAEAGHLPAIAAMGYFHDQGIKTPRDPALAEKWFRMAAERGHPVSQYNLAKILVARDTPPPHGNESDLAKQWLEGVDWFHKAAEGGMKEARSAYGIILMRGDYGTKANPRKATTFLIPAAESGDLEAMNALGYLYQTGNGVNQDRAAAEIWFRKAAEGGNIKAMANLGNLLDPGSTNYQQKIEAIAWLRIAEDKRDPVARRILIDKKAMISEADLRQANQLADQLRSKL
jgi:uncharacterized protein